MLSDTVAQESAEAPAAAATSPTNAAPANDSEPVIVEVPNKLTHKNKTVEASDTDIEQNDSEAIGGESGKVEKTKVKPFSTILNPKFKLKNSFNFPVKHVPNLDRKRKERIYLASALLLFLLFFLLIFIHVTNGSSKSTTIVAVNDTKTPTIAPTHIPTESPTTSPTDLGVVCDDINSEVYAVELYMIHFVAGYNYADIDLDPQANLKDIFEDKIASNFEGTAPNFRLIRNSIQRNKLYKGFVDSMRFCDYKVALFSHPASNLHSLPLDDSYNFTTMESLSTQLTQYIQQDGKYITIVEWPETDLTNNLDEVAASNILGPDAESGTVCKDVIRDTSSPVRYDFCSRQIYLASIMKSMDVLSSNLQSISFENVRARRVVSFWTLSNQYLTKLSQTSTRSAYRGEHQIRDSYYEGFIRSRLLYSFTDTLNSDFNLESNVQTDVHLSEEDVLHFIMDSAAVSSRFSATIRVFDSFLGESIAIQPPLVFFSAESHQGCDLPLKAGVFDRETSLKLIVDTCSSCEGGFESNLTKTAELYDLSISENTNWLFSTNEVYLEAAKLLFNTLRGLSAQVFSESCRVVKPDNDVDTKRIQADEFNKEAIEGVIIILADDIAKSDISLYGTNEDKPKTPHIDNLGKESIAFNNFYSNAAVCSPSRASILTGKYPFHVDNRMHGAIATTAAGNQRKGTADYLGQDREESHYNINQVFKSNGFITAHFGKWHLGFEGLLPNDPIYALDQFQLYAANQLEENAREQLWDGEFYDTVFDNFDLLFPSYSSEVIVDRSVKFIENRILTEEKYLMHVSLQNAHAPLNTANLSNRYENEVDVYNYLLEEQDTHIGRLIEYLRKKDKLKNTLILFLSDNGAESVDRYFASVGNRFSPLRGNKRSLYDGGILVPAVMHIPNVTQVDSNEVTSNIDIFPSFVGLLNLSVDEQKHSQIQGADKSCAWLGACQESNIPVLFEYREPNEGGSCAAWSPRFAVRLGNFKILFEPEDVDEIRIDENTKFLRTEVFNVQDDPTESTNLIVTAPETTEVQDVLKRALEFLIETTQSPEYDASMYPRNAEVKIDVSDVAFLPNERCEFFI